MTRFAVTALATLLLAAPAATATTPKPAYVKALERRVTALEQSNRTLRASAQSAQAQAGQALDRAGSVEKSILDLANFTLCMTALQSDFNTGIYNIVALMVGAPEADFRLDDKGACAAIGITRGMIQTASAGNADPRFSALASLRLAGMAMRSAG